MAAITSTRFIPFVPPPNPSSRNGNGLRPSTTSRSTPSLPSSSQEICRPAAVLSRSGGQSGAERNAAARAEGWGHTFTNNDDNSDEDLPSLEELLRTPPRPTVPDKFSRIKPTSQHLDQPALGGLGIPADRKKSGIGRRQGDSSDQPMILDDDDSDNSGTEDEAEVGANDLETGPIDEDRYIDGGPGPFLPRDVLSAPAQDPTGSISLVSKSLQNHTPHSLPPLLNGSDGWTDKNMAEFEGKVELALLEEVNSSSTSAPSSPRHSVDPPQDNINTKKNTTSSRPEELQDAARSATCLRWERQVSEEVAPHSRRSRCHQSPSTTSFEVNTLPRADHGFPTTVANDGRHYGSESAQRPSAATEECLGAIEEDGPDDSVDEDNSEDEDYTLDTDDEEEDPRPAERQKPPFSSRNDIPTSQHPSASILDDQLYTPRRSRSPSATRSSELVAEYREWPFQGFLKSARIGPKTIFSFEIIHDDSLELSAPLEELGKRLGVKSTVQPRASQGTTSHSKNEGGASRSPKKRNAWTEEEDAILKKMREEGYCTWEEISAALPLHTQGSIQVRYSQHFSSGAGSRKRRRS